MNYLLEFGAWVVWTDRPGLIHEKTNHGEKEAEGFQNPFSRGEGGPPERSEETAGRKRNAGGYLEVWTT